MAIPATDVVTGYRNTYFKEGGCNMVAGLRAHCNHRDYISRSDGIKRRPAKTRAAPRYALFFWSVLLKVAALQGFAPLSPQPA
jgi:hypothetical protein